MKLNIPNYCQQKPSTCLPSCIKAVLEYFGTSLAEDTIVCACRTTLAGTIAELALEGIRTLGYDGVLIEGETIEFLLSALDEGHPVIVFVDGAELPYATGGAHAVVVCGYEAGEITCMDPALGQHVALDIITFLRAWLGMGYEGLLVLPQRSI
jgi:ABC-type bacteriocin/lantibiotic exporter with double-glycine peptidase domain